MGLQCESGVLTTRPPGNSLRISFFLKAEYYSMAYFHHVFAYPFIPQWTPELLLHLATVIKEAVNMDAQ